MGEVIDGRLEGMEAIGACAEYHFIILRVVPLICETEIGLTSVL